MNGNCDCEAVTVGSAVAPIDAQSVVTLRHAGQLYDGLTVMAVTTISEVVGECRSLGKIEVADSVTR